MTLEVLRNLGLRGCILGLAFSALAACNTMSGLGEDVEAAGSTLSDTAEDVKE